MAITAVIWMNAIVIWCLANVMKMPLGRDESEGILLMFANIATTGLVFFCVAWLLSSFTASPAISVLGGLVAPSVVYGGFLYVAYLIGIPADRWSIDALPWYRGICLTLAPVCFVVGTWYYLRRVEP